MSTPHESIHQPRSGQRALTLADNPFAALPDWELRQLVIHLTQARRTNSIHWVMRQRDSHGRNAWFEAKKSIGDLSGFLLDVDRAWAMSESAADERMLYSPDVVEVGREVRYALTKAVVGSIATQVPASIAAAFLKGQLWTAGEALTYALQVGDWADRLRTLTAMLPHLGEPEKGAAGSAALALLIRGKQGFLQTEVSAMPVPERQFNALDKTDSTVAAQCFEALILELPDRLIPQALQAARAIPYPLWRVRALCAAVKRLHVQNRPEGEQPDAVLAEIVDLIERMRYGYEAAEARALAAGLHRGSERAAQITQAAAYSLEILGSAEAHQARALAPRSGVLRVVPKTVLLEEDLRPLRITMQLMSADDVRAVLHDAKQASERVAILGSLVSACRLAQLGYVKESLELLPAVDLLIPHVLVLEGAGPYLPEEDRAPLVAAALARVADSSYDAVRTEITVRLLQLCDEPQVAEKALELIEAITRDRDSDQVPQLLGMLCPRFGTLSAATRQRLCRLTLRAMEGIRDGFDEVWNPLGALLDREIVLELFASTQVASFADRGRDLIGSLREQVEKGPLSLLSHDMQPDSGQQIANPDWAPEVLESSRAAEENSKAKIIDLLSRLLSGDAMQPAVTAARDLLPGRPRAALLLSLAKRVPESLRSEVAIESLRDHWVMRRPGHSYEHPIREISTIFADTARPGAHREWNQYLRSLASDQVVRALTDMAASVAILDRLGGRAACEEVTSAVSDLISYWDASGRLAEDSAAWALVGRPSTTDGAPTEDSDPSQTEDAESELPLAEIAGSDLETLAELVEALCEAELAKEAVSVFESLWKAAGTCDSKAGDYRLVMVACAIFRELYEQGDQSALEEFVRHIEKLVQSATGLQLRMSAMEFLIRSYIKQGQLSSATATHRKATTLMLQTSVIHENVLTRDRDEDEDADPETLRFRTPFSYARQSVFLIESLLTEEEFASAESIYAATLQVTAQPRWRYDLGPVIVDATFMIANSQARRNLPASAWRTTRDLTALVRDEDTSPESAMQISALISERARELIELKSTERGAYWEAVSEIIGRARANENGEGKIFAAALARKNPVDTTLVRLSDLADGREIKAAWEVYTTVFNDAASRPDQDEQIHVFLAAVTSAMIDVAIACDRADVANQILERVRPIFEHYGQEDQVGLTLLGALHSVQDSMHLPQAGLVSTLQRAGPTPLSSEERKNLTPEFAARVGELGLLFRLPAGFASRVVEGWGLRLSIPASYAIASDDDTVHAFYFLITATEATGQSLDARLSGLVDSTRFFNRGPMKELPMDAVMKEFGADRGWVMPLALQPDRSTRLNYGQLLIFRANELGGVAVLVLGTQNDQAQNLMKAAFYALRFRLMPSTQSDTAE